MTISDPSEALAAVGIHRAYSGVKALRGVDVTLRRGEVLGLIGPNGAGKSTLVNMLTGYDRPDEGAIMLDGTDITGWPAHRLARTGVARTYQRGHLYRDLSVRENVEVAALATGRSRAEARGDATGLLELFGAADRSEQPARTLPHGLERRLGVARAMATRPNYLLLDEPAAGLNEGEIGEFGEVIRSIAATGVGVLLIDHNIRLIMAVCERIHVIVQGRSYLEGTPDEVRGSQALVEAYLGRSGTQ
ncbi:ABC transporter ATP-binding protein [Terrabacter tumescens]|uniref:ABC transporter ATP-binding protein n=1 Tax=Terrabacter tumescens TaxID=60443 RepID=A0ABQ2I2G1_9MICO|nr:ABC transporter ATP-binding protein [Terrabacter tumescens]GGM98518.1 ABC transporter ATP-binding protein [Terrabacter tumescens]